ncbi:MAG TPA: acyloxyacyl hydrolase [Pyrinomonadaceae bacterium]|jgi:hypothetical protein
MKIFPTVLSIIALTMFLSLPTYAQSGPDSAGPDAANASNAASPQPSGKESYTLKRGDNEFGGWGGISFKATTIFAGLSDAEAADRKFFIAAFRYGRTLAANDALALQYTVDAIPVAVATGVITSRTIVGGVTTFHRETAYGGGISPLGLQLDFANGSKVHPFVHVNAGLLGFTKPVPIEDSGKLAFTLEGGGGVRIFTSARRAITVGVRFHHISNGDRSGSNRGLNQFVFYGGYSFFK